MIPTDWSTEPLGRVARFTAGRTPPRANLSFWEGANRGIPWVAISDMENYGTITDTAETITPSAFEQVFRRRIVPAGTMLMSFKLTIGRVSTLGIDACNNEAIISIYPRKGVDQRYLGYYLSQIDYADHQDRQVKGNTLNQDKLNRVPVVLPSLIEQKQIADVLDFVQQSFKVQRRAQERAQDLKAAAMRELVTRGLRGEAQKETPFGLVPEGWGISLLDQCAEVQTGVAKGRKLADQETIQVPYLRVANVQDGHLDLTEIKIIEIRRSELERYLLRTGDVVLTEGGDFDKLGRGFIWRRELDLCVHQNHIFAVRPKCDELLPEFFAYLAQSAYGKAYFLQVAHKTTNLACINTAKLKAFPVLIPTLDEQRDITTVLDAIDRKIDLHKRKKAALEELFKSLLDKLMTGAIRVADLDLSALEGSGASVPTIAEARNVAFERAPCSLSAALSDAQR
jgi:type I restriction enzyme S subunit